MRTIGHGFALLAVVSAQAQVPLSGAPSPSSLLNDLRSMQFPPSAGGAFGGVGAGQPLGGLGAAAPSAWRGGQPPMPGQGAGVPGLGGLGLGGFGGGPLGGGLGAAPQQAAAPEAVDLACSSGAYAIGWNAAKLRFSALLASASGGSPGAKPLQLAAREALTAVMEGVIADVKAVGALSPQAADECGLGKLCLQLLSLASVDDAQALAQVFTAFEQLGSPVLTMLLDVPWAVLAQSGWPFFGLLAQINLRKAEVPAALNTEAMDGLDTAEGRAFQVALQAGLEAGDGEIIQRAAMGYLQQQVQGSALGSLTALAAQAILTTQLQDRLTMLQTLQVAFRQVIGNAAELDVALSTRWPLWGLLHAAVDLLAA